MKKLQIRSVMVALGLLLLAPVATVMAQNNQPKLTTGSGGNGFRISPVRAEYTIDKGDAKVVNITLENPSSTSISAKGVVNDFVASDKEDGEPRLILDENTSAPKNSFKQLVQSISDVTLAAKEKKEIPVTIRVPSDAHAGGYYGAIRFVPIINTTDQKNVGLTASVGTIVLVTVPGELTEKMSLVQIGVAAQSDSKIKTFFTKGDLKVITRLKNTGDVHVKPFGKVQVKNMFGKVVYTYEFNNKDPRDNVLPDSTRRFEDNLPHQKWLGKYTVESNLGYSIGSGDLILSKTSFWYFPAWFSIAVAIVVIAIAVGIGFLVYKFRRPKHGHHD